MIMKINELNVEYYWIIFCDWLKIIKLYIKI